MAVHSLKTEDLPSHPVYCPACSGGGRVSRFTGRPVAGKLTPEVLQAAVKAAIEQGLLPKLCQGDTECLANYGRIEAVLRAAFAAA